MTESEGKIIADIRNKFGSIYTYFQLEDMMINGGHKRRMRKKLKKIQSEGMETCIEAMKIIKKQLDSLG